MKTSQISNVCRVALMVAGFLAANARADMLIESISGPVTQNEINSFKTFMSSHHPAITSNYWDWTFTGSMGPDLRALDLMYQITGDRAILDKAIEFADVAIQVSAGVPGGGPPSEGSADGIGHAAFCAKLILQNPSIWNLTVGIGDPYGYGTTYHQRALSYIQIGTQNMDTYITPVYVNASDKHFKGITTGLGWNRQTMIANGYHELANCHELLNDNPNLVASYRQIVGTNIQWFLSRANFYTASGKPVVTWFYGVNNDGTDGHLEDVGHAGWDILGLTRCAQSGLYGITTAQMTAFANNVYYVMYNTTSQDFGGSVDGTGTRRQSLQPPWTELARYLTSPDLYVVLYNTELFNNNDKVTTNPLQFATFMTEKNRRYLQSQDFSVSVTPSSQTVPSGGTGTYTATVTASNGFNGTVSWSASGLPSGATKSFNPTSVTGSGSSTMTVNLADPTTPSTYNLDVTGTSSGVSHSDTANLTVSDFSISVTPGSQTVTAGSNTTYTVNSGNVNGYTGNISLGASGLPANATATFNPTTITAPNSSTMTVSTTTSTPAGTNTLTVTGTGSSASRSHTATLIVNASSVATTYEAEKLAISASSGDTVSTNTDGGSGGAYVQYSSNATNDYVQFTVTNVSPGAYTLSIGVKKYNNRGITQVQVNKAGSTPANIGSPVDLYSSSTSFTEIPIGTWTIGTQGDKWVKFLVTGKNASSSGYNIAIDYIKLTPQ